MNQESQSDDRDDSEWKQISQDLAAYRRAELFAWNRLQSDTVTRFLDGCATSQETLDIERDASQFPSIRHMLEILKEVLTGFEPGFDSLNAFDNSETIVSPVEFVEAIEDQVNELQDFSPLACQMFGIDSNLIQQWKNLTRERLAGRSTEGQSPFKSDRLFAVAAGESTESCVNTSIPLFTALRSADITLSWEPHPDVQQWGCLFSCPDVFQRWESESHEPAVQVPDEWLSQLPPGSDILWKVDILSLRPGRQLDLGRESYVRGVFRFLTESESQVLQENLAKAAKVRDPNSSRLSEIGYLMEKKLFLEATASILGLSATVIDVTTQVLLKRALSALYGTIQTELSGYRQLGTPEGLWALDKSQHYLQESYAQMKLGWPFRQDKS